MLDEHCHIIWGVDDGSESFEESLQMLDAAKTAGIDHIIATPHARWDDFDIQKVRAHFEELVPEASSRGIRMELGFEVYYKRLLRWGLDAAPALRRQGTDSILIEFNTGGEVPYDFERTVYRLQSEYGLDVTLAHPERYVTCMEDFDTVYKLQDMGCRLQVSAGDLYLGMFNKCAKVAKRMLKEGLCDALVSDAHCPDHYKSFSKAIKFH